MLTYFIIHCVRLARCFAADQTHLLRNQSIESYYFSGQRLNLVSEPLRIFAGQARNFDSFSCDNSGDRLVYVAMRMQDP